MLLQSELEQLKFECGYNLLTLSALPYAFDDVTQIFEQVVQPYLQGGALTYSSTPVCSNGCASSVSLALLSATGINVGDRLVVDQDMAQEYAHVTGIAGNAVTCLLSGSHQGTYPVATVGGESIVRGLLRQCIQIATQIGNAYVFAGLSGADEVKYYASRPDQKSAIDELKGLQKYWRSELCSSLGLPNLREERRGAGQNLESY